MVRDGTDADGLQTALLDPSATYKPLDVGNGRVAGSVAADGAVLAMSGPHPTLGAVTLGGAAPFPDDQRRDAPAVRAHRARLASPDAPGLGLSPPAGWTVADVGIAADAIPRARLRCDLGEAVVTTWSPADERDESAGIVQRWTLRGTPGKDLAWRGRIGLGRSALTQLTEGGIVPAPAGTIEAAFSGDTLTLRAPGVAAALTGLPGSEPFRRSSPGPVDLAIPCSGPGDPGRRCGMVIAWALGRDPDDARRRARALRARAGHGRLAADAARWRAVGDRAAAGVPDDAAPLVRRALTYTLACCAWQIDESVCLVTDHQILPLAWTRDAYYLSQALLARPLPDALDIVGRHLRWLFQVADRPEHLWGRAYLPNGSLKDRAFQLDQQCYPLLELADYLDLSGDAATASGLAPEVRGVLDAILDRRAAGTDLVATQETPGDDPVLLPYHFSSHVVLWRTLRRVGAHARLLGLDAPLLAAVADRLHREIRRRFTVTRAGRRIFAYPVDLEGGATCYHDANDVPTALAPLWGFCAVSDAVWRATMRFAFSPANRGWFPGRFSGLGSSHTPAPWPLGDVQELVVARLLGDPERTAATIRRLVASACWDGALPEARDPEHAGARSGHWFAWPGAALAAAFTHRDWQPPATAAA